MKLHEVALGTYRQIAGAAVGVLDKGAQYCQDNGIALQEVVDSRLYPDMASFHFQVVCITHHSLGAINGIKAGEFTPPDYPQTDYAGLQAMTRDTLAALQAMRPEDVDSLVGRQLVFKLGGSEIPFTAENFILSFSLPNFYFHATTAYAILRARGVPLGKRDFIGKMKIGV